MAAGRRAVDAARARSAPEAPETAAEETKIEDRGIWGFPKIRGCIPTIMENQMEQKMEHEMETGII